MKRILGILTMTVAMHSSVTAAEHLKSFDHAAELTSQAKTILFQELELEKVPNSYHREVVCLAENIYFEARGENFSAKAGVANVTRNRVNSQDYPNTFCDVVYQGPVRESWKTKGKAVAAEDRVYYPRKHRCQFSWYCDGQKDVIWANYERTGETIEGNALAWRTSVQLAIWTLGQGEMVLKDNTKGALFYYNHNLVYPHWADHKTYIGILGNHTFMK
jgi:spore germination cell wall hydrolase CwlJ-like protein